MIPYSACVSRHQVPRSPRLRLEVALVVFFLGALNYYSSSSTIITYNRLRYLLLLYYLPPTPEHHHHPHNLISPTIPTNSSTCLLAFCIGHSATNENPFAAAEEEGEGTFISLSLSPSPPTTTTTNPISFLAQRRGFAGPGGAGAGKKSLYCAS